MCTINELSTRLTDSIEELTLGDFFEVAKKKEIYSVKLHIGGNKLSLKVSLDFFDLSSMSDEQRGEFKKSLDRISVRVLPIDLYKKLRSIDNSVRQQFARQSVGGNSHFISKEELEKFVSFWDKKKEEYFAIRDLLVENYSSITQDFLNKMEGYLQCINSPQQTVILRQLKSMIPSKESFNSSFYMAMEFTENVDIAIFSVDSRKSLKEAIEANSKRRVESLIGNTLSELKNSLKSLHSLIEDRNILGYTVGKNTINKCLSDIEKFRKDNIFDIKKIEDIITIYDQVVILLEKKYSNDALSLIEDVLFEINEYANEIGIALG